MEINNVKNLWKNAYQESANPCSYIGSQIFQNGREATLPLNKEKDDDIRLLLSSSERTRVVVPAEGYCLSIPVGTVVPDFSLGQLRSRYLGEDFCLTVSLETKNPYFKDQNGNTTQKGYDIYMHEWLEEQIQDDHYLKQNKIARTCPVKEWVENGFSMKLYGLQILESGCLEKPFYQIAILRPETTWNYFFLLVMKSEKEKLKTLTEICSSFKEIPREGIPSGEIKKYNNLPNPQWNPETKEYYQGLSTKSDVDFGAFPARHVGEYADWLFSEQGIGTPDVYMTYLHVGWQGTKADCSERLAAAQKYAGGDGKNGLPIFNLTYQFTETNNATAQYTPVFDILRGEMDDFFRKIAGQLKSYRHPILFRLNNEMNTDWTDYCGMMLLLDPDLFQIAWRRMYDIFAQEHVDNLIWIFNPIYPSCPYSNWGESLCYFPGEEYVQMLGLTYYQMNNLEGKPIPTFQEMYNQCADNYLPLFVDYPWIIGEYACGIGGEVAYLPAENRFQLTEFGRNASLQTEWVRGMLDIFRTIRQQEKLKNIRIAIWFSANDVGDYLHDGNIRIMNALQLSESSRESIHLIRSYLAERRTGKK